MNENSVIAAVAGLACVLVGCQYGREINVSRDSAVCDNAIDWIDDDALCSECKDSDIFSAYSFDGDGDNMLYVTLVNKTPDMLLVLHKVCGMCFDARYEDCRGCVRFYQTGTIGMADWETSMLVLNGQGPDGSDVSCFCSFPIRLPFKFKRILDLQLNIRYAKPRDIASAESISEVDERCNNENVPVDMRH